MRIMGLDFGSRTVGVAISDSLLLTAQGVEIIRRKEENKLRQTLARIEELIVENEVEEIVLGLPKNMNDTEGVRVELTKEFKDKLERRTGLPVYFWDERLTTVAADKAMMEAGIRRENRKDYVDMIAATLILQGYLDRRNNEKKKGNRMSKLEKITFRPEGEEPVEFYVLEQTRIGGHNYILVTDVEEGDGDALILKDMSQDGEEESIYDVVSDDEELEAVSGVFADMLEDVDLI